MSPEALNLGCSPAARVRRGGALVNGYQAFVQKQLASAWLAQEAAPKAFAAVPFLVFAAPFHHHAQIPLLGCQIEGSAVRIRDDGPPSSPGSWSLMSALRSRRCWKRPVCFA